MNNGSNNTKHRAKALDNSSILEDVFLRINDYYREVDKQYKTKKLFIISVTFLLIACVGYLDYPNFSTSLLVNLYLLCLGLTLYLPFVDSRSSPKDMLFFITQREKLYDDLRGCKKDILYWVYSEYKSQRDDWHSSRFWKMIPLGVLTVLVLFSLWKIQATYPTLEDFFNLSRYYAVAAILLLLAYASALASFVSKLSFFESIDSVLFVLKEAMGDPAEALKKIDDSAKKNEQDES